MSPKLFRTKWYRARWFNTAISVLMIAIGVWVAVKYYHPAYISDLERYKYGDSKDWLPGFKERPRAPLCVELVFILGYGLVLIGFAWIYRCWAASSFGRNMARYVLAAVIITVAADSAKDCFLDRLLDSGPAWFSTVVSAAATIKWCAALLALGGIAAVGGLGGRGATGVFLRHILPRISSVKRRIWRGIRWTLGRKRENVTADRRNYANWWDDVWAPTEPPFIKDSVTRTCVEKNQTSWQKAYKVPDADTIIEKRIADPVQAICLSGGGVRSACIAMGATQVFSQSKPINATNPDPPDRRPRQLIDTVDYVISVSGGGFTAGARLLATQHPAEESERPLLSERFQEGSAEFDQFRRCSSYIADSPAELITALAVVLKNLIASLAILFTVPAVLGWVFGYLSAVSYFSFATFVPLKPEAAEEIAKKIEPSCPYRHVPWQVSHGASWWAVGSFVFLTILFTMLAILVEWFRATERSELTRLRRLKAAQGSAVLAVLVLAVVAGLPGLMRLCSMVNLNPEGATKILSGVVGLNYVSAIVTMVTRKHGLSPLADAVKPSWWKRLLPPAVLQLILALLTSALLAAAWLVVLGSFAVGIFEEVAPHACEDGIPHMPGMGLSLLALAVLLLGFADVTSLSLHPFYRSRLARTFAVRRVLSSRGWQAARYPAAEWTWLPEYGKAPPGGPKFIFATAATLSGEATTAPGLDAVSYVLSADYIGGPELGWLKTPKLLTVAPPRIRQDLTVIASMAVSGAAFASAMGRQNKGYQKLLALSGARLGTWLPNPKLIGELYDAQKGAKQTEQDPRQPKPEDASPPKSQGRPQPKSLRKFVCKLIFPPERDDPDREDENRPWPKSLPTIRGAGYFYRELLGINYDDARLVQLTDGGHYENLGLVEALRRRCRLIFCIDAGGDAPPLLSSLSDAMRLAKYELGVTIELNERGQYSVNDLAPGSGRRFPEGHALARLNSRLTNGTVVFGKISYPPAAGLGSPQTPCGFLIFAKAVLWKDCPEWLLTYAASSEVFPHDPTSDQWFSEAQFAAYTALGRIMGNHAVECVDWLQRNKKL